MALEWTQKGSLRGPQGEQGPAGPAGDPGAGFRQCSVDLSGNTDVNVSSIAPSEGIKVGDLLVDPQGDVWEVASVGDGTVHTAAESSLNIRGPQGAQGPAGEDGTGVSIKGSVPTSSELPPTGEPGDAYIVNDTGNLWVWDTETSAFADTGSQIKGPKGDQGEPGEAATVTVGTTTTGEPGTDASVSQGGTDQARVLNFTIPRGATGAQGPAGPGVSVGTGSPSDPGSVGECYIDMSTGNLYRYEDNATG